MTHTFNTRHEVEALLGYTLSGEQLVAYTVMRDCGYANPYDIVASLPRYVKEIGGDVMAWASRMDAEMDAWLAAMEVEMCEATRDFHTNF
jgi:hypothetical protein